MKAIVLREGRENHEWSLVAGREGDSLNREADNERTERGHRLGKCRHIIDH